MAYLVKLDKLSEGWKKPLLTLQMIEPLITITTAVLRLLSTIVDVLGTGFERLK